DGVMVEAGFEAGTEVGSVEAGCVDRLSWIAYERPIVGCAAITVHVDAADVEGSVIAGLQLRGSGDGDVAREGAQQQIAGCVAGMESCGGPDVTKRYVLAMIPDRRCSILSEAAGCEVWRVRALGRE